MTTQREFQDIVSRLHAGTGDPNAWMTGLSPAEVQSALFYSIGTDEPALNPILAKIRANHPGWFDGAAAAPTPPGPTAGGQPQTGAAATAVKKAESDLAQQNSATATLDLMVISAVLNAHATSTEGAETLRALQREIDDAVRTRTDLDTPAGARDFQRFLVGKLRHIGRVVEEAGLDDRSKAALATAWTALYESTKRVDDAPPAPPPDEQAPAPTKPAAAAAPAPELPPYGAELPMDLMADPFAGLLPPRARSRPSRPPRASRRPRPRCRHRRCRRCCRRRPVAVYRGPHRRVCRCRGARMPSARCARRGRRSRVWRRSKSFWQRRRPRWRRRNPTPSRTETSPSRTSRPNPRSTNQNPVSSNCPTGN